MTQKHASARRSRALVSCLLLAGCVLAAGCRPKANVPTKPGEHDQGFEPTKIFETVAALRGLTPRAETPIALLSDDDFVRVLERKMSESQTRLPSDSEAPDDPFELLIHTATQEARALQSEQTVGFYDEKRGVIFLRKEPRADDDHLPLSWILAHEATHALQHQHFTIPEKAGIREADARLALAAVLEGDAMVSMLAYGAKEAWFPLNRVVAVAIRQLDSAGTFDEASALADTGDRLSRAAPLMREQFIFPYAAGTRFVGLLHRAGGFDLVNELYRRFPRTTEQVLHPEKYLAGEGAVPVDAPSLPPGAQAMTEGTFGELQLFGLLQLCVDRPTAARAAAGWGGDAYTVGTVRGRGSIVMLNTAWDSPDDALEFAKAISACYEQNASRFVRRKGRRVSAVAGIAPKDVEPWHRRLLDVPDAAPSTEPPIESVRLIPFRHTPAMPRPKLESDAFVDFRLGIRVPIPPGFTGRIDTGTLSATRAGPVPGILLVGLSEWVVNSESLSRLYSDFASEVKPYFGDRRLEIVENRKIDTPLGRALERTWSVEGTRTAFRVVAIPICRGTGAIVLSTVWADEETREQLDWALGAIRPLAAREPPVCFDLDP